MTDRTTRRIILGLTGSIAAYKVAWLARRLIAAGDDVQVVMTEAAKHFVGPMTFAAITGNAVRDSLWDEDAELAMGHLELARWADHIVIAPASADAIARLANGRADDLLSTLCLASEAPVHLAPAMNYVMWTHPATQANATRLAERGTSFIGPEHGALAERESGAGRMAEPETIFAAITGPAGDDADKRLAGRRVLVTAGPTIEAIDPVRYITNHSSGRMGFAVAAACAAAGAEVTLIAGPTALSTPPGVARIDVDSTADMHTEAMARAANTDIFAGAAAVADYTPAHPEAQKLKKSDADETLKLVRTPDIIAEIARDHAHIVTLGFAAETKNMAQTARAKRRDKGLTMIAGNRVGPDHAFGRDDNALTVITDTEERELGPAPKRELADVLTTMLADALPSD
ncbi:bifunctional phosphopantothenoylcysteine decarboxylase/phosphopantothenate--cysteine ligase CoaBC [Salinisphaera orenii]|uniref:bifunctional phosphopantothenoylcysteine decarboxylase/phosphopantothenate--cysteine ligase CoaBC n=1 Tax=Salinisphaera orenii TaxID=856731 RepID=UPI000DBE0A3F